jgi:thiamine-phosphate pyrophosphorylase
MAERCLLYFITDRGQFPGDEPARRRALLAKIVEAARAGVDYIQLREKDLSTRELELLAEEAASIVRERGRATNDQRPATRLLINSRTDVALATGADGVHLRSDDIFPSDVRSIVENNTDHDLLTTNHFLIAVSCHSQAEVLRARSEGADFAVFAPVFEKRDRREAHPTGLVALREACQAKLPVLALGGVTLENAASCLEAGAAGIAAIRLFQENKIEEVVRTVRAA